MVYLECYGLPGVFLSHVSPSYYTHVAVLHGVVSSTLSVVDIALTGVEPMAANDSEEVIAKPIA